MDLPQTCPHCGASPAGLSPDGLADPEAQTPAACVVCGRAPDAVPSPAEGETLEDPLAELRARLEAAAASAEQQRHHGPAGDGPQRSADERPDRDVAPQPAADSPKPATRSPADRLLEPLRGLSLSDAEEAEETVDDRNAREAAPVDRAPIEAHDAAALMLEKLQQDYAQAADQLDVTAETVRSAAGEPAKKPSVDEVVAGLRGDKPPATRRRRRGWPRHVAVVVLCLLVSVAGGYAGLVAIGGSEYDSLGLASMLRGMAETPAEPGGSPDGTAAVGDSSPSDGLADEGAAAQATPPSGDSQAPINAPQGSQTLAGTEADRLTTPRPFEPPPLGVAVNDDGSRRVPGASRSSKPKPAGGVGVAASDIEMASASGVIDTPGAATAGEPAAGGGGAALLVGAPQYDAAALDVALADAGPAAELLASTRMSQSGRLEDIGRAYATLCDLAETLTLLRDADAGRPETTASRQRAEELFSRLLRSRSSQADSRRVATRWLAWSGRPHGGVFFAGVPGRVSRAGSVVEYRFELADGAQAVVISAKPLPPRGIDTPLLVVGSLVTAPAERVKGYTGDAEQAIWLGHAGSLSAER